MHHGGAGTLHASARSGRPTLIAQIFGDQPAHAVLVNERGFGLSLKSMPKDLYMNWGLVAKRLKNSGLQSKTNVGPQNVGNQRKDTHCVGYLKVTRHPLLSEITSREKVMERKRDKHRYLKSFGSSIFGTWGCLKIWNQFSHGPSC